ncbi:uncharacterized protein LOC121386950 [Gigantopelta aegis]|uniref:uncharacterized protein LOC121386950 n=1 Tax=Gigantopelta aegis TaxID=1735272 RepID=UPI001B88A893|nr:uncharacterized protein LOC121386950 [Gigantopelta aegis]
MEKFVRGSKKKQNAERIKCTRLTGGGPAPKELSPVTAKIVDIFADDPSFIGLPDGLETIIGPIEKSLTNEQKSVDEEVEEDISGSAGAETSQNMENPRKRKYSLMKSGGQHNDVDHLKKTRTGMPGDELKNLQMAVLKEELPKIKEERELIQLQKTKLQLQINFIKGHQSP